MLRNFVSQSKAAIKLLQKENSCAPLLARQHNQIYQRSGFLSKNFKPSNYLTNNKIPIMSISTTSLSLSPPSKKDEGNDSNVEKNIDDDSSSVDTDSKTNSNNIVHEYNTSISADEYSSSNSFPLCDKSLPVMPRYTITSTTAMHLNVTTSPRLQNFTTSSTNAERMGNQEVHCPECEKM